MNKSFLLRFISYPPTSPTLPFLLLAASVVHDPLRHLRERGSQLVALNKPWRRRHFSFPAWLVQLTSLCDGTVGCRGNCSYHWQPNSSCLWGCCWSLAGMNEGMKSHSSSSLDLYFSIVSVGCLSYWCELRLTAIVFHHLLSQETSASPLSPQPLVKEPQSGVRSGAKGKIQKILQ